MSRVKLPSLPMDKKTLRSLKKKYVSILNATERVDHEMVGESIVNYLKPQVDYRGKVCMDLGANIGTFTQIALDGGADKVITVECDPRNFQKIKETFGNDDYVELIEAAVSGLKSRTLKIFKSNSGNNHCSTSIMSKSRFNEYDEVKNIQIKKLFDKYKPDIVKIDIESAEYTCIEDILEYFPDVLFIEFHGGKHKHILHETTDTFIEKYNYHEIEPLVVFQAHTANDCFFKK